VDLRRDQERTLTGTVVQNPDNEEPVAFTLAMLDWRERIR
jgi:hypothetical protein